MADGDFLACYLTSDFMALSYQKKLIETVIDAHKTGKSLADDPTFAEAAALKKSPAVATVYAHLEGMMGWTEFDMKLRDDFIYFTGVCHETDTCFTFMNVLRQQESVEGFPGEALPSTAFYFTKQESRTGHLCFLMEICRRRAFVPVTCGIGIGSCLII